MGINLVKFSSYDIIPLYSFYLEREKIFLLLLYGIWLF